MQSKFIEFISGILCLALIYFLIHLFFTQLADAQPNYLPTRQQILHFCETAQGEELTKCLSAADRARD